MDIIVRVLQITMKTKKKAREEKRYGMTRNVIMDRVSV